MWGKLASGQETALAFAAAGWSDIARPALAVLIAAAVGCTVFFVPARASTAKDGPAPNATGRFTAGVNRGIFLNIDPIATEPLAVALQSRLSQPIHAVMARASRCALARAALVGTASTYNPYKQGDGSGGARTASGEPYEPQAWAAAIQIDLRAAFAGVRYGRSYRPVFALVTAGDKSAVIRINDVVPLRPGRVIDLSEGAMRYFDATLERGLLPDVRVTPMPEGRWRAGPLDGGPAVAMAGEFASDLVR